MKSFSNLPSMAWLLMLAVAAARMDASQAFGTHAPPATRAVRWGSGSGATAGLSRRLAAARTGSPPLNMARNKDVSSEDRGSENVNKLIGIDRGYYLYALVIALNVWFFSIPTEFRRTRICDEADSARYPQRCMTTQQFATGIADYYKNGGGIKFDFSIAGKE